jgi:uncharacterized membrane protein HdeD (DUF308 family)
MRPAFLVLSYLLPSGPGCRSRPRACRLEYRGIVFIVLGFLAIVLPVIASPVVTSFIGWLLIVGGILYGYHAFGMRGGWNIAATVALALLTLASGIILLIFPLAGMITLTMFLTAYFIAAGIQKAIPPCRVSVES